MAPLPSSCGVMKSAIKLFGASVASLFFLVNLTTLQRVKWSTKTAPATSQALDWNVRPTFAKMRSPFFVARRSVIFRIAWRRALVLEQPTQRPLSPESSTLYASAVSRAMFLLG